MAMGAKILSMGGVNHGGSVSLFMSDGGFIQGKMFVSTDWLWSWCKRRKDEQAPQDAKVVAIDMATKRMKVWPILLP